MTSLKRFEKAVARYVASLQSPPTGAHRSHRKRRAPMFNGLAVIITVPGCILYQFDARLSSRQGTRRRAKS